MKRLENVKKITFLTTAAKEEYSSAVEDVDSFHYNYKMYLESAEAILLFVKGKVITFAFQIACNAPSLLDLFLHQSTKKQMFFFSRDTQ